MTQSIRHSIGRCAHGIRRFVSERARRGTHAGVAAADAWNARMFIDSDGPTPSGTRWGRGLLVLVPAVAATGVLGAAITQGALASSFNVANQQFEIHAASLKGSGLGAVIGAVNVKNQDSSTTPQAVLHAGMDNAELAGLCMVAKQSFMGATYSIVISSTSDQPAGGQNVLFDVTDINAMPAVLSNAVLGRSADEITAAGQSLGGQPGGFGLDVSKGNISLDNIKASAYNAQIVGQLNVPGLRIALKPGEVSNC